MKRAFLGGLTLAALLGVGSPTEAAEYGARYSVSAIPKLCTNLSATVTVTVTNTGTLTWIAGGSTPFRLSYHVYQGPTLVTYEGQRTALPHDVLPGANVTLSAVLKVPSAGGSYLLKWDMVQETVTWFSTLGVPTGDVGVGVTSHVLCIPDVVTLQPRITSTNASVSPGDVVLVWGHLFGQGGTIALQGDFAGKTEIPLTTLVWQDDIIGALVPDDITGVLDQPATIRVTRGDGATAGREVPFLARRQIRGLSSKEVQTTCSNAAWRNRCNGVGDAPFECCSFNIEGIATLVASHQDANLLGNFTADSVSVDLKNGWVIDSCEWGGDVMMVSGCDQGAAKATVSVTWATDGWLHHPVRYWLWVVVVGPIGVPLQ